MRFAVVVVFLSLAVMVVMIYQAVRQELSLHDMKVRMVKSAADVKRKEEAIIETKVKVKELKTTLASVNKRIAELKTKKLEAGKSTQELDQSLQGCTKEKQDAEKKSMELKETMSEIKAGHEALKYKAEVDIQSLKQQILDRDKAICAFVDTTKQEARKLCGIS